MLTVGKMQFVGGFMGHRTICRSGVNSEKKLKLLQDEGVLFDLRGKLIDRNRIWAEFQF